MTEQPAYVWTALRDRAVRAFGEQPNRDFEGELIPVFMRRPEAVTALVDGAIAAVRAGRARSGWAVVRTGFGALVAPEAVATGSEERDERRAKVKANALAYVRDTGGIYPTEAEARDDLFGEHGIYKRWPELETEVMGAWRQRAAA